MIGGISRVLWQSPETLVSEQAKIHLSKKWKTKETVEGHRWPLVGLKLRN
ncbi:rCG33989 [Rattus norvegicus]|uniref:RCG33989 n=1 Tax=Rattus norvegicus TaxID=10116 RepID=A6HFD0_RAT|nr:rCG33989 [Rattus norvegicus]